MNPAEIHLAMFPFGGTLGAKLRPVLLLSGPLGSVPEVLMAYTLEEVGRNFKVTHEHVRQIEAKSVRKSSITR